MSENASSCSGPNGEGDVYTYSPLGGRNAYAYIDTASLLLLAVQASRLIWRRNRCHPGVQAAWRTIMAVARGRHAPLTQEELTAAERQLPHGRRATGASLRLLGNGFHAINPRAARDVVAHALYLAGNLYARYTNAPLGDRLSSSLVDLLGEVAFLLRHNEPRLQLLHELEARCLIHGWTHTQEVIPAEVLRDVLAAGRMVAARARAQQWRQGTPPPPFPIWTPPPPTAEEQAVLAAADAAADAARAQEEVANAARQRASAQAAAQLAEARAKLVPPAAGRPARLVAMPAGEVELWTRLWDAVLEAAARGALSPIAAEGRIRYNQSTLAFEGSVSGGAYAALATGVLPVNGNEWARLTQALARGLLTAEETAFLRRHYRALRRVQREITREITRLYLLATPPLQFVDMRIYMHGLIRRTVM